MKLSMPSICRVVRTKRGVFEVRDGAGDVLLESASRETAQRACNLLNAKSGKNPQDVFARGRWIGKGDV